MKASIDQERDRKLSAIERGHRDPTSGRGFAADAVEAIIDAEANGDGPAAYRAFLQLANDLAAVSAVDRLLLTAEEPSRTGPALRRR